MIEIIINASSCCIPGSKCNNTISNRLQELPKAFFQSLKSFHNFCTYHCFLIFRINVVTMTNFSNF